MLLSPHGIQDAPQRTTQLQCPQCSGWKNPALIIWGKKLSLTLSHAGHQSKPPGVKGYKSGNPASVSHPHSWCVNKCVQHPGTSVRWSQSTVSWGILPEDDPAPPETLRGVGGSSVAVTLGCSWHGGVGTRGAAQPHTHPGHPMENDPAPGRQGQVGETPF